ncbi:23S rRNA (adenine(2503)-C(2))-methyltransferase RlmN [Hugenholtzia roseola]|uniref:23S rRNA (adenine(2503)-C(2))-methyltransferase RlmN n=1 Tax=Hugenholtzia roseola TaxID=1002 RepID=UPI00040936F6|nr:23S rRNA (adenine(2503)-C(2))-methyltransferase RlmN [Hugenholtzia roseola]
MKPIRLQIPTQEIRKPDIRKQSLAELTQFLQTQGEKSFRAKQIYQWIWQKSAHSFEQMSNLSQKLRDLLSQHYAFYPLAVAKTQQSEDGTIKSAFKLDGGHLVEGVLIPAPPRMTACISSQVGCSLSCKFCATGYMDKKRNIDAAEIYDQVVAIQRQAEAHFNLPLSNIVFMGMGEPLMNYQNVLKGIEMLTSPDGLNMSPKRITVSTAGIAKFIKKLGDDEVKFNLALSLHAANDEKRNQIMPINDSNNLAVLREALMYFYQKTKNRITYEYIMFDDFNDSLKDAEELFRFTKHTPCRVNIIEYNPISEAEFRKPSEARIDAFAAYLVKKGVMATVRRSRGKDIDAACGQLANKG